MNVFEKENIMTEEKNPNEVHAESRAQLDDLYRAITSHPKVKVAL